MSWTQTKASDAANQVSRLSEFLALDGFETESLRYLTDRHIKKFLKAIDAEEATKVFQLANELEQGIEPSLSGFPILDWLRVIGGSERRIMRLETSDGPGNGATLIIRLIEFQPEWIGRWWKWRCNTGRDVQVILTEIEKCVGDSFKQSDFEKYLPILSDLEVAAIVARKPQFALLLPLARCASIARYALTRDQKAELIESLSGKIISFDAIHVIDSVMDLKADKDRYSGTTEDEERARMSRLDQLVDQWRGPTGSDPVALAIIAGHKRLEMLFRSKLSPTVPQSTKDDDLWKSSLSYYAGGALASAMRAAPNIFRLDLGFILGVRLGSSGIEPSYHATESQLQSLHIKPSLEMIELYLPVARLWSTLRLLAKYPNSSKHDVELSGLRAKTASLGAEMPDVWAQSLNWILLRLSAVGDVAEAVTIQLSISNSEVRNALEEACGHELEVVRLKAQGLRALLRGMEGPETSLARALADAAARYLDGRPIFPHPLAPASATWQIGRASR